MLVLFSFNIRKSPVMVMQEASDVVQSVKLAVVPSFLLFIHLKSEFCPSQVCISLIV